MLIKFDDINKKARLLLRGEEILRIMNEKEEREKMDPKAILTSLWRPEVLVCFIH